MALAWLLAVTLLLAGLIGVGYTLLPPRLGSTEWEVAAFGQLAATMALPEIGLALLGGLSARSGCVRGAVVVAVLCSILAAVVSLGALVMALNLPVIQAVTAGGGDAGLRLRLLTLKTVGLSGIHGLALWFMTVYFAQVSMQLRRRS